MSTRSLPFTLGLFLCSISMSAQVPQIITYQGKVAVQNVPHHGPGQFKFSLVGGSGAVTFWSNDGTGVGGSEPVAAVPVLVNGGLYSVSLGYTALPNMQPIPPTVFMNPDLRLRVWFNDGQHGSQ